MFGGTEAKVRQRIAAPRIIRRGDNGVLRVDYLDPDEGDGDGFRDLLAKGDLALSEEIATKLNSWPETRGPFWKVIVSHEGGYVKISIPALMPEHKGYICHIDKLIADPSLKQIMRGCGELLERFNIPRVGVQEDYILEALAKHPLGYRGLYRGENPIAR